MSVQSYVHTIAGNTHIKSWTKGVHIESEAMQQAVDLASLPFIYKHIAIMPDAHAGKGSLIGSVIATEGAVVPSFVGVDIGCGIIAVKTNLKLHDIFSNLQLIHDDIEATIPHGRTDNGGEDDKGKFKVLPKSHQMRWDALSEEFALIAAKRPLLKTEAAEKCLGTLGAGNHYIECCTDDDGCVWVMIHSGSRGVGAKIGGMFTKWAQEEMDKYFITQNLKTKDHAYLVEGTELFKDYMQATLWAQKYAQENREAMAEVVFDILKSYSPQAEVLETVNCHHNYVTKENHFGKNVWITRKGAVCARTGKLAVIAGSMGDCSYIVEGKGNRDSYSSCSHGAGRKMSRNKARETFTLEQHKESINGVISVINESVIDETPLAYKPIDDVMAAQADLVTVKSKLKQFINIKG
ncbi:RNA-splicing ligase [Vibrio chagasii]|nr:RNA-splicing ligase [Vibrio chagasii]